MSERTRWGRRRFLVLTGGTVALAGCAADQKDDGSETDGDDPDEDEDTEETDDDADDTDDTTDEDGDDADDEPEEEDDDSEADSENDESESDDESDDNGDEGETDEGGQLIAAGESHSFEGEGATVSEEFSLSDGIATVEFGHDGERNFIVDMLDLEGDEFDDELLVNVIGSIEGRSVIPVGDSQYQLDVDADGAWSLDLDQPGVTDGDLEDLPLSAEGTGPDFVGPVSLEGVTEVEGSHTGESNFIVETRTAEGGIGSWDLVFNEIGEFEGSATTRTDGVAWIDVNADGDWTLEIGG